MRTISRIVLILAVVAFALLAGLHDAQSLPTGKVSATVSRTNINQLKTFKNPYATNFQRSAIFHGAGANTSIYVPGITTTDQLLYMYALDTAQNAFTIRDLSDSAYIQANDSVRCGTTTALSWVWIFWFKY